MADLNRPTEPDRNDKRNGEGRIPQRTVLLWTGILSLVLVFFLINKTNEQPVKEFTLWTQLKDQLDKNNLVPGSGKIIYGLGLPDLKRITGSFYDPPGQTKTSVKFSLETALPDPITTKLMESGQFQFAKGNNLMVGLLYQLLPIALILGVIR